MGLTEVHWIISIICTLCICQVNSQGASLSSAYCPTSVGENSSDNITFQLNGSPPLFAFSNVQFFLNDVKPQPDCVVSRILPCNETSTSTCGCEETSTVRTFYYEVAGSGHEGNWTTFLGNLSPADELRSPPCEIRITAAPTTETTVVMSTMPTMSATPSPDYSSSGTPPDENSTAQTPLVPPLTSFSPSPDNSTVNHSLTGEVVGGCVGVFGLMVVVSVVIVVTRKRNADKSRGEFECTSPGDRIQGSQGKK